MIVLTPDLALSKSRSTHSRGSEGCFYLSEAAGKEVTPFPPYRLAGQDFLCSRVVLNGPRGSPPQQRPALSEARWHLFPVPPEPPLSSPNTEFRFEGKGNGKRAYEHLAEGHTTAWPQGGRGNPWRGPSLCQCGPILGRLWAQRTGLFEAKAKDIHATKPNLSIIWL